MSDALRVSAEDVRARVQSGDAMLVCAYDSDDKFRANHLEGGLSYADFQTQLPGIAKDRELVFYCA